MITNLDRIFTFIIMKSKKEYVNISKDYIIYHPKLKIGVPCIE